MSNAAQGRAKEEQKKSEDRRRIERPMIILGAPRSGTSLLFSILSSHPRLWSLYTESEWLLGRYFRPGDSGYETGHELGKEDAAGDIPARIRGEFYREVQNYQAIFRNTYSKMPPSPPPLSNKIKRRLNKYGVSPVLKPRTVRIVEKTPKNCLRVPFLKEVFPDAFFVFLTREPCANISSLMEGWKDPARYHTHKVPEGIELEDYAGEWWSFFLPTGWKEYTRERSLAEVCAFQYRVANEAILTGLSGTPEPRKLTLSYEDLVEYPQREIRRVCETAGLGYEGALKRMAEHLPVVNSSTAPDPSKWQKNAAQIRSNVEAIRPVSRQMGYDV